MNDETAPGTPAEGHVLYVCTGCNYTRSVEEKSGTRGGRKLWNELHAEIAARGETAPMHLEPVHCLNICPSVCAVAFVAPNKYSYSFGYLRPDQITAAAILDCAELYAKSHDGYMPRGTRPKKLRYLISRVPPVGHDPNHDDDPRRPRSAAQVTKPKRPW